MGGSTTTARRLTLVACILASSIVFVDGTVVNVALPSIQRDLGGGLAAQQWIVDAYLLTLGSLILVGGSLGDIFGERRILAFGVGSFGAASLLCAFAPDTTTLIVCRGLQGIAGALLTPSSLAVIVSTFEGAERGAAIGTWTAWSGISTIIGPLVGGWLIGFASWRWIFVINAPLAAVTLALVLTVIPRRPAGGQRARIDVAGALLCVSGLGLLVFAFIEQPRLGWHDPLIPAGLALGAAALALFVAWERRVPQPMLPLRLFGRRNFSFANIETFAIYAGISTLTFFLALFLQQLAGWSPFRSGLSLVPLTIVMFAFSRHVGKLSARFGPRLFMGAGPLLVGASLLPLVRLGASFDYWTELFPSVLGVAFGLTLTVTPLTTTVLADAGQGDAGIASGVNNAVARVAGLIGIAVVGIAASGGTNRLSIHGFHVAMLITAAFVGLGGALGALGIRNPG